MSAGQARSGARPEVRQLEHFVAVAEELNFTRAASRLHIVQQALSKSVAQLEARLRVRLLDRSTRQVSLTPAGKDFLERAREALAAVDQAVASAERHATGRAGSLRVGLCATGGLELTPLLLGAYAERYPDIEVQVRRFDFDDPRAGTGDGTTDVAIVRPPFTDDELELLEVGREPRCVVLPARHRLAGRASVSFAELVDEPWMAADGDQAWCHFWRGDEYRDRPAPVGAACRSLDELLESARAGRAAGLVPASTAQAQPWPGLVFVRVMDIAPAITAICWRAADRRPAVRRFVALARDLATADTPAEQVG
jgi:DNA-binding transcriptional LysR family regulator